jgi:hypothetical protein
MSNSQPSEQGAHPGSREETMAALFANLVIQQTNMALMFLGQVPHPETGERVQNLDAARMFIDQLEMIEFKTKGNLDRHEEQLLRQSLTSLRMGFVQAMESASKTESAPPAPKPASEKATAATEGAGSAIASGGEAAEDEHRKKFSKKY